MRNIGFKWFTAPLFVAALYFSGLAQISDSTSSNPWHEKGRKSAFRTTGGITQAQLTSIASNLQQVVGKNSTPSLAPRLRVVLLDCSEATARMQSRS